MGHPMRIELTRKDLFVQLANHYTTRNPNRYFHSGSEWTWEQWQWRCTPYSPKRQTYSLTTRWFSFVSRILIGNGVLPFCRDADWTEYFSLTFKMAMAGWTQLLMNSEVKHGLEPISYSCHDLGWSYLPTTLFGLDMTQGQFLSGV